MPCIWKTMSITEMSCFASLTASTPRSYEYLHENTVATVDSTMNRKHR